MPNDNETTGDSGRGKLSKAFNQAVAGPSIKDEFNYAAKDKKKRNQKGRTDFAPNPKMQGPKPPPPFRGPPTAQAFLDKMGKVVQGAKIPKPKDSGKSPKSVIESKFLQKGRIIRAFNEAARKRDKERDR